MFVYDILQDDRGFLNIATAEGLTTFEGYTFKKYDTANGLSNNIVSSISKKSNQDIILGHIQNGLSIKTGEKFSGQIQSKKIEGPVTTIFCDGGLIYFGTKTGKIGIQYGEKIKLIDLEGASIINKIIKVNDVILIATDNGIYWIKDNITPNLIIETEGIGIESMLCINASALIAGTSSGEIISFLASDKKGFNLIKKNSYALTSSTPIKSLIITKNSKLVIGTWGNGIYITKLNLKNLNISDLINIGSKNGLDNLYISCLIEDFNENIWIGTFGGGLYKFNNFHFRLYNKRAGLNEDNATSVLADDNKLLVGSEKGFEVLFLDRKDTIISFTAKNKFVDDKISSFGKLNKNEYLIGTEHNGLYIYNFLNSTFINFFKKNSFKNYPKTINHINVAPDSNIYISTIDGLFIYNPKFKKITQLTTLQGLPHNNILNTFLDSKNRLWFVAPKSSPGVLENDSITLFKDLPNFKSFNATGVCEGNNNDIYISTNGDGIYQIKRGRIKQYSVSQGLGSNYVMSLAFVKSRNALICTHPNGLSVYHATQERIIRYTNKSVLKAYENSLNAICSNDQTVYFATQQGLGVYVMDQENTNSIAPRNLILKLKINNKNYTTTDTLIELPYDNYDIRFDYVGIELSNPNEVVYTYKLEGLETDFKNTKERTVEYYKIKNGTYIFNLNSYNSLGIESVNSIKLKIFIDKPIYQKWWFILLMLLSCISFIVVIFKIRTRKLFQDNLLLEKKVAEKTENIIKINKLLEAKNEDITSSIDYAKRIQNVLLPQQADIEELLDVFILDKPRDIVSGDFYWFYKTDKFIYLAVVDCTGHGVPGAFMSLIGSTFLYEIMLELNNPLPSEILLELDKKVVSSLRQKSEAERVRDGMDMALCRFDLEAEEFLYSGAGRPLCFVQNGNLIEIKLPMYSIGGYHEGIVKEFKNHTFKYSENDMIYIYSDGYCDQFGGDKGKRYSTKKIKETFLAIHEQPLKSQLAILNDNFYLWKGKAQQIDDVLVIGVKLK